MLEDFYSDFFPVSLASPGAQGLRESCRPSANTAPVSRHSESQQSQSSSAEEEALLCRETLLRVAGGPGAGEGELGRPAARGRRPQAQPALPGGDPSAGFKRQCPAGQERRGPAKVHRPAAPIASRSAFPDSGRPRSPELLVPDSDYMEEAEAESECEWRHCRATPQAGGPSLPHRQPAGGGEPGGRAPRTPREDPQAGLGPAAGGDAAALRLQAELWGAAGPARPGLWPEGEEALGGCGRSASPRSLADLEDQVLLDIWLPEE